MCTANIVRGKNSIGHDCKEKWISPIYWKNSPRHYEIEGKYRDFYENNKYVLVMWQLETSDLNHSNQAPNN